MGNAADVAPTAKAAKEQRARHLKEGSTGRIAARVPGKQAQRRPSARS